MLFLLPLVCMFVAVELTIGKLSSKLLSEKYIDKKYECGSITYEWANKVSHPRKVLLLGSSSVKYGLSCTQLNHLSNDSLCFISLAGDAQVPVETFELLKKIDLKDVKAVYLALDPWYYAKASYRYNNTVLYFDFSTYDVLRYFVEFHAKESENTLNPTFH